MDRQTDIFGYIQQEEAAYQTAIRPISTWEWNMKEHIETSYLYKNSQLTGNKRKGQIDEKPVRNIIRPILNLQYRAEGFDVKDINLYVNDSENYYKSFFIGKYHEKWARENGVDTLIDNIVETYVDIGGVLVKNVKGNVPEVVPWTSIAFADQTDILSGPFAIKHYYSEAQLREMEKAGWGNEQNGATATIDQAIRLAQDYKNPDNLKGTKNDTPGRYIEVYEVHGSMPKRFLKDTQSEDYVYQMQIVLFYIGQDHRKSGITLFAKEEKKLPFKFLSRDPIHGRALGFGGIEELTEPQVWVNYAEIRKKEMLDAASKTVLLTNDPTLANKHPSGLRDVDNLEILDEMVGGNTRQLDTFPRNYQLFENLVPNWEQHAQQMASANDSIMGENPSSGTPFKLQELVTSESHSLHEYRKGKIAVFIEELYREWILPTIVAEMVQGQGFLSELSLDELETVADQVVSCKVNDLIRDRILSLQVIEQPEVDQIKEQWRQSFLKGGTKRFIQILKDEMREIPVDISINIVGKQKYLAQTVDKLTNVLRFVFSTFNPQTGTFAALDDPRLLKPINEMLEFSGISPISSFGTLAPKPQQQQNPSSQLSTGMQPQRMQSSPLSLNAPVQ